MNVEVVTIWTDRDAHYLPGCRESVAQLGLKHTFVQSMDTAYCADYNYTRNRFSFANERNRAIAQTSADWVLMLDCDERLSADSADFQGEPPVWIGGFFTTIANTSDGTTGRSVRLFRRGAYYVGRCHEQVVPSLVERGWKIGDSRIVIRHVGYEDRERVVEKCFRNIGLLADDILSQRELGGDRIIWLRSTLDLVARLGIIQPVTVEFEYKEFVQTMREHMVDVRLDAHRLEDEIRYLLAMVRKNASDTLYLSRLFKLLQVWAHVVEH